VKVREGQGPRENESISLEASLPSHSARHTVVGALGAAESKGDGGW